MPNKIAILKACMVKEMANPIPQVRYTLWERTRPELPRDSAGKVQREENVLLCYDTPDIVGTLESATFEFGMRNMRCGRDDTYLEGNTGVIPLRMAFNVKDNILFHYLGDCYGHACYVVYSQTQENRPYYFRLKEMPGYGNNAVLQTHARARTATSRPSSLITPTPTPSKVDHHQRLAIFDFMHTVIEPFLLKHAAPSFTPVNS